MLEQALATAQRLKKVLEQEVERARHEREVIRTLNGERLFAGASARSAFNKEVGALEKRLGTELSHVAEKLGLAEASLTRLRLRLPDEAEAFCRVLSEVRALAGALCEIDRLNLTLAGRALACVQGYLTAMAPPTSAYNRYGGRLATRSIGAFSSKA